MLLRLLLLLFNWHIIHTLAAPSTPNPRSFLQPLDKRWSMQCYNPPPNTFPPIPSDCVRVARNIACGSDIQGMLTFSSVTGWKVPYTWIWSTCSIVIDIQEPGNPSEFASLEMISLRALQLVQHCVMSNEFKSGGRTTIGKNNLINIFLTGLGRPSDPLPSLDQCLAMVKGLGP